MKCEEVLNEVINLAHDVQLVPILSRISSAVLGLDRPHISSKSRLHPLHLFFALYTIDVNNTRDRRPVEEEALSDVNRFRAKAKSILSDRIYKAHRALRARSPSPRRSAGGENRDRAHQLYLTILQILSGNLIPARRHSECLHLELELHTPTLDPTGVRVTILFDAFIHFNEGRCETGFDLLKKFVSFFEDDLLTLKLISDDPRSSRKNLYSKILGLNSRRASPVLYAPPVTDLSRLIARAAMTATGTDESDLLRFIAEVFARYEGLSESFDTVLLVAGLHLSLSTKSRSNIQRFAAKLRKVLPCAATFNEDAIEKLQCFRAVARRDFSVNSHQIVSDVLCDEWIVLWPRSVLTEALHTRPNQPAPSVLWDIDFVILGFELLGLVSLFEESPLLSLEACNEAQLLHSRMSRYGPLLSSTESFSVSPRLIVTATLALTQILAMRKRSQMDFKTSLGNWHREVLEFRRDCKRSLVSLFDLLNAVLGLLSDSDFPMERVYLLLSSVVRHQSEIASAATKLLDVWRKKSHSSYEPTTLRITFREREFAIDLFSKQSDEVYALFVAVMTAHFLQHVDLCLTSVFEGDSPATSSTIASLSCSSGDHLDKMTVLANDLISFLSTHNQVESQELHVALLIWLRRRKEAEEVIAKNVAAYPSSVSLLYWQGVLAETRNQPHKCLKVCEKALRCAQEEGIPARNLIGLKELHATAVAVKSPAEALTMYSEILSYDPQHVRVIYLVGKLLEESLFAPEQASYYFKQVLHVTETLPSSRRWPLKTPSSIIRLGRTFRVFDDSLEAFTETDLRCYKGWSTAELASARLSWRSKDLLPEDTRNLLHSAINLNSRDIHTSIIAASLEYRLGKYQEAVNILSPVLSSLRKNSTPATIARAHSLWALCAERLDLLDIAIAHCETALTQMPFHALSCFIMGWISARRNRESTLLATLSSALASLNLVDSKLEALDEQLFVGSSVIYLRGLHIFERIVTATTDVSYDLMSLVETAELIKSQRDRLEAAILSAEECGKVEYRWLSPEALRHQLVFWEWLALLRAASLEDQPIVSAPSGVSAAQIFDAYVASSALMERNYLQKVSPFLPLLTGPAPGSALAQALALSNEFEKAFNSIYTLYSNAMLRRALHEVDLGRHVREEMKDLFVLPIDLRYIERFVLAKVLSRWKPPAVVRSASPRIVTRSSQPKQVFQVTPKSGTPNGNLGELADRLRNMKQPINQICEVPITISPSRLLTKSDFIVGQPLGSGGFGTVYAGTLIRTGRPIAIKLLKMQWSRSTVKDMLAEINTIARLNHPNLVEFIGACLDPQRFCLVTELCPGGSLFHRLHRVNKCAWSWTQRKRLADQIIAGVEYLHSQRPRIIHRDLKSLNVVLNADATVAKICDFGLTSVVDLDQTHISLKRGGLGGSPRYMAPECFSSNGRITEKVDIWALGCVLIEVFGGTAPFTDCRDIGQVVKHVVIDRRIPVCPSRFSTALKELLRRCFVWEPSQRPDATEIRQIVRTLEH